VRVNQTDAEAAKYYRGGRRRGYGRRGWGRRGRWGW
jgi:hypothetical protein